MANDTVKIDSELKKKIEEIVKLKKIEYPSMKNFVDKAILMLIESENIKSKNANNKMLRKKGK